MKSLTSYLLLLLLDHSVHLFFLTLQQCVLLIEISNHLQISYMAKYAYFIQIIMSFSELYKWSSKSSVQYVPWKYCITSIFGHVPLLFIEIS